MRITKYREPKSVAVARKNRLEIIAAGLNRREMIKFGLISGAGYLVNKHGLSQWASGIAWAKGGGGDGAGGDAGATIMTSPPTRSFIQPMPIMAVRRPVAAVSGPTPTIAPNTAAGEGRTRAHQGPTTYPQKFPWPPAVQFETHQKAGQMSMSPDLPVQTIWGHDGVFPAPTYYARYGEPILVRNFNELPPATQNGGFGIPEVSTHLHNLHSPSESDGFPCDFFPSGQFYDHHYTNVLAGFASTNPPDGDINESLSTLWYHDHRVDFTSQNVYKGLAGFYFLYNQFDTGNELTGFRIPGVPGADFYSPISFDVPLVLADRVFDPSTGLMFFDLFNLDGILGDKFLVNGAIQPFFEVEPRRYRFRIVNSGPSRWYQTFLTDLGSNTSIPFWLIAADGNLLPRPVNVTSAANAVAERQDIIIDFRPWAGKTLYLENRLQQVDGRGPTGNLLAPGQGNLLLQFRVKATTSVADNSLDPSQMQFYALPDKTQAPRVTRNFVFERGNGMWQINGQLMTADCSVVRLRIKQNTAEHWVLTNNSGGWMHPIHIHTEEFQILTRNGVPPGPTEISRKDVSPVHHNETVQLFFRFRDWQGRYPLHCHNVVHEDHAMMLRWDIDLTGDTTTNP